MRINRYIIIGLAYTSIVILNSCKTAKTRFSNSHQGIYKYDSTEIEALDVTVSTRPLVSEKKESKPPKTFVYLPDSLKYLYLEVMSERTKTPEQLVKALQIPIDAAEKAKLLRATKFDEFQMVFEVSNIKKYFNYEKLMHPGTRVEFLNTSIKLDTDSYASFYTIDKLQNEIEEVDMGELNRTQTVKYDFKLSGDGSLGHSNTQKNIFGSTNGNTSNKENSIILYDGNGKPVIVSANAVENQKNSTSGNESNSSTDAKLSAKAEANYANEEAIKEGLEIKLKRMRLGFSKGDKFLTISQRALPLGDASLNVFVTATLKFKESTAQPNLMMNQEVWYFENLYNLNQELTPSNDLIYSKRVVSYLRSQILEPVKFKTSFEGAIRIVGNERNKSGNNALEFDDYVTYQKLKTKNGEFLLDAAQFGKEAYTIVAESGLDKTELTLYIASPVPMQLGLFLDDEPELFLQWVKSCIANPNVKILNSNKLALYFYSPQSKKLIDLVSNNAPASISNLKALHNIRLKRIDP